MSILSCHDLGHSFGEKTLFSGLNLSINTNDKIALIGENGAGKSTFLQIISGLTQPHKGHYRVSGQLAFVQQINQIDKDPSHGHVSTQTTLEYIMSLSEEWMGIVQFMEQVFDYSIDLTQNYSNLSGGQLRLLAIASKAVSFPDLLILDEPTNHLDWNNKQRLIQFLQSYSKALLIVSHDPDCINQTCSQIWELKNQTISVFGGNYDFYLGQKQLQDSARQQQYSAAVKELKKVKDHQESEARRASKSLSEGNFKAIKQGVPKVMRDYMKNRSQRSSGKTKHNLDKREQDAHSQVEKFKPDTSYPIHFVIDPKNLGKRRKLLEVLSAVIFINQAPLFQPVDVSISYGDRLHVQGKNGSGKTSLIQAIQDYCNNQLTKPELKWEKYYQVSDLEITLVDQTYQLINREKTLVENLQLFQPAASSGQIREALAAVQFRSIEFINQPAKNLSGGESVRLFLAMISLKPIELLILDEPTNNLDLESRNALLEGLQDFPGSLILISHDHDFAESLECEVIKLKHPKTYKD